MAKKRDPKPAPVASPAASPPADPPAGGGVSPAAPPHLLALRAVLAPLAGLAFDPQNAREHGDDNLAAIEASLREFGQDQPLVVQKGTNRVIKGNGRLRVMRERLGWQEAAVVWVEEGDAAAVARALADNRSAELAHWNFQILADLFRAQTAGGRDMATLGWKPHEVESLLAADWRPPADPVPAAGAGAGSAPANGGFETPAEMGPPVSLTKDQRAVFDRAAAAVRAAHPGAPLTDGRILELIAADYLAGAKAAAEAGGDF